MDPVTDSSDRDLSAVPTPRVPGMVLLLSFVTCYPFSIYMVYWWYVTACEIKATLGDETINPNRELLLNIVTLTLYSIYLSYKYPKLILKLETRVGIEQKDQSTVATILSLVSLGPIAAYLIQADLNRIWELQANRGLSA